MEEESNISEKELEEYVRFENFCEQVIFPNQPQSFVARSTFHTSLMFTACRKMTATAAPRGFLKSTTLARYRPLHRLCDMLSRPELNSLPPLIMIVSETSKLAKEHLQWIKDELQNNKYLHHLYGDLTNPNKLVWNEDEIQLTNGARCVAKGYDSQIRGLHPTDIVVDDIESLRNMATEESLEKLKDWFYRVLMGSMIPETNLTVIGTIIARESLLSELVLHEEFSGRIWKALESKGEIEVSLWPDRYPVSMLKKLRDRLKTHRFNAEFQNEPLGLGEQIIYDEWVRRHTAQSLTTMPTPVRRYICCDPAFTEERWGDYSAIVVMDESQDGTMYERLAWRKKVALPELRDAIMAVYRTYSDVPVEIGIEEVAAQKAVRQAINELDPSINLIPLRPDKDKARRLIDVSRYFEMGRVSLMTESLITELLSFPMGDKDRVDALVYCCKLYERNHPVINSSKSVDTNPIKHLDDTSLQAYAERYQEGNPSYYLPSELRMEYYDSIAISEELEDWM